MVHNVHRKTCEWGNSHFSPFSAVLHRCQLFQSYVSQQRWISVPVLAIRYNQATCVLHSTYELPDNTTPMNYRITNVIV